MPRKKLFLLLTVYSSWWYRIQCSQELSLQTRIGAVTVMATDVPSSSLCRKVPRWVSEKSLHTLSRSSSSPPSYRIQLFSIRGGGSGGEASQNDDRNTTKGDPETADIEDAVAEDASFSSKGPRPLSTPFYLNDLARYEASMAQPSDENPNSNIQQSFSEPQATDSTRDLTTTKEKEHKDSHKKQKKKKKRKRDNTPSTEKDHSKPIRVGEGAETMIPSPVQEISGLDDQSLVESEVDLDERDASDEQDSTPSAAASLWWGNVWTQQFEQDDERVSVELEQGDISSSDVSDNIDEPLTEEELSIVLEDVAPSETVETLPAQEELQGDNNSNASIFPELPIEQNMTLSAQDSQSPYVSSGIWGSIDNLMTLGLASKYSSLRVSKQLRGVRKWTAHVTGLHGALSGKPSPSKFFQEPIISVETPDEKDIQGIQRRIAAIDRAKKGIERARAVDDEQATKRRGFFGLFRGTRTETDAKIETGNTTTGESEEEQEPQVPQKTPEEIEEERQRMERVKEIDRLISEGQARLQDLICEKDVLQRRPNPLFDYKKVKTKKKKVATVEVVDPLTNKDTKEAFVEETIQIKATRKMNFPPDDLVAEYLDMMISTRRLVKMNHTYLWKESESSDDDEEETIGDDLFTASADAHRLYQSSARASQRGNGNGNNVGGGGSWLLRQSLVGGPSLGEKIGEAAETAAYKAVCAALMSFLARMISSLHGINVMKHSDIRLVLEQAPDFLLYGNDPILPGVDGNYAEETIKTVIRRKSKRSRRRSKHRPADDSFVQRDAVTEMLLSHVQISAPLLKLFPLAWQRALLGNIITLATAVISDFLEGLRFQILGHELSFTFRPITEEDMILHFQLMSGGRLNHRKFKAAEFEAAVRATAEDVSEQLKFLDRWHERALGSGVLRTQIANMIARIVLTLTDEILSAARMDLWSSQAGGPRILAGLEYRTESIDSV
ncbi:hypothetical protein IV203_006966 [Nitzschia inconspicua]|uniref:Uncharacterized protein n=1 Tax=Nitzschia inconspicua TaxID=303405 RepID=A0A9K3KEM2_9STRA|nr:hypothetical protein IV203_006966 [Nitzschia inconspicua]